jgi:K+-sensing histidine kinase KdpD/DNA-binding winged helix-turn-helix (wHTH) protein
MTNDNLAEPESAPGLALRLAAFVAALLMVAAATLAGTLITPIYGTAPVVLLYLPPVLAAASWFGLAPALLAALASTLAYNFFFTAPYRTLLISSPADLVTVIVLFLVALVTSKLASALRHQARLAAAHAARNATIAGFARRLLASAGEAEIAEVSVHQLARLFDCHAVLVSGQDKPSVVASDAANVALAPSDLAAAAFTLASGTLSGRGVRRVDLADWQFHPVASDQAALAAVGLARPDGRPPIADEQLSLLRNLLDQMALALERTRLEREARDFSTLRERHRLRSALLTSIGEDVKPRLHAIATAARGLRREGLGDKALIATVAAETTKVDRYIDDLVDLSPGADSEPIAIGPLTIDLHRRAVLRDGAEAHLTPKEYAVLAELAKHAGRVLTHAQLLRAVWGPAHEGQIDYLRVAIRALRQKLERNPARPELLLNEPAVGYRLVAPSG